MAIRVRVIDGQPVALCAARSMALDGDVYLDDGIHHALSQKFAADFKSEGFYDGPEPPDDVALLVEREESNNPNRTCWDQRYASATVDAKKQVADYYGQAQIDWCW